ncbi:MAG: glycosyltransferase [Chitinophagaceae bacterium]
MKVSVCVLTYNHRDYIEAALNGICGQNRDSFALEVLIADDSSTDGTFEICTSYASKFDFIKVLPSEGNLGMEANFSRLLNAATGDFIAICEGDDYWCDTEKLQKQVQVFQQRPEVTACYHNAKILLEDKFGNTVYPESNPAEITFEQLVDGRFMKTCTLVLRNRQGLFEDIVNRKLPADDTSLCYIALDSGGVAYYINEVMAVYRVHSGGVWSMLSKEKQLRWAENSFSKYVIYYRGRKETKKLKVQLQKTRRELIVLLVRKLDFSVISVFGRMMRDIFSIG